jgi:ligand-binding sensor domain-containing protein
MRLVLIIVLLAGYCKSNNTFHTVEDRGIVYFSKDNGASWQNRSKGLPDSIFLTDIAVSNASLGIATKRHGIFLFDSRKSEWIKTAAAPPTSNNLDALYFHRGKMFTGTQGSGVFVSEDEGKTWKQYNTGLTDLTIRKFTVIDNVLYAGTNGGLYSLNEKQDRWILEYGQSPLQVNGIIEFDNEIYIGTNQGAFKAGNQHNWKKIMSDHALHNISAAGRSVYALAYNELFVSSDKGTTWYSAQNGMPTGKYSFQLMETGGKVLVGQWDGVYRSDSLKGWQASNNGLPESFAATEMKAFRNIIVIASSGW